MEVFQSSNVQISIFWGLFNVMFQCALNENTLKFSSYVNKKIIFRILTGFGGDALKAQCPSCFHYNKLALSRPLFLHSNF